MPNGGLLTAAVLAQRIGPGELVDQRLRLASEGAGRRSREPADDELKRYLVCPGWRPFTPTAPAAAPSQIAHSYPTTGDRGHHEGGAGAPDGVDDRVILIACVGQRRRPGQDRNEREPPVIAQSEIKVRGNRVLGRRLSQRRRMHRLPRCGAVSHGLGSRGRGFVCAHDGATVARCAARRTGWWCYALRMVKATQAAPMNDTRCPSTGRPSTSTSSSAPALTRSVPSPAFPPMPTAWYRPAVDVPSGSKRRPASILTAGGAGDVAEVLVGLNHVVGQFSLVARIEQERLVRLAGVRLQPLGVPITLVAVPPLEFHNRLGGLAG